MPPGSAEPQIAGASRPGRGSIRSRTTLAVLLGWLSVAALSACTGRSAGPPTAPTPASVRAVLARHGAAMLHHSPAAFLAGIDTSAPARTFRRAAAAEVSNASGVPFADFAYHYVAPVTDASTIAAARRRYGAPVLVAEVEESFELAGIDTVPDTHDLWWVFVRRAGRTLLAGQVVLDSGATTSWRAPWDYGAVVAAPGRSTLVLGYVDSALELTGLAGQVDTAVRAVSAVWGTAWSQRVAVLVPASAAEFSAYTGQSSEPGDAAAVAVTTGIDPQSGRPYGQWLVINPALAASLSGTPAQIVLRHEVTHLASAADTSDTTPRWLVEGFAEYVGELAQHQPVRTAAAELAAQLAHGRLPSALPSAQDFDTSGAALAAVYQQSWLACRLIAQRAGVAGLVRFYRSVGTALLPAGPAVRAATRQVLHETPARFSTQWRAYLKAQLT